MMGCYWIVSMLASLAAVISNSSAFVIELIDCSEGQSVCADMMHCVSTFQLCDGYPDCRDGSDERETLCYYKNFTCTSGGVSLRASDRCDGRIHCPDGSDELNCRSTTSRPTPSSTTAEFPSTQSHITNEAITIPTTVSTESNININISQENEEMISPTTYQLPEFKPTQSDSDFNEDTTWTTLQQHIEPRSSDESALNPTSSTHHFLVPDHTAFTILDSQVLTSDHQTNSSFFAFLTTCATATIGFLAALAFAMAILIPIFNYVKKRRTRNERHTFGDPAVLVVNRRGNTCFWVYQ